MAFTRRKTREIKVGGIYIGGSHPVTVQSMTNRPAHDFCGTIEQIKKALERILELWKM